MAHKLDKKKYDASKGRKTEQKVALDSLKADKAKKANVSALADRVLLIEQALGV